MKLENIIFDGIEYTLVDIYKFKENLIIYHFAADKIDVFCQKFENEYLPIKNIELIEKIKEKYRLKESEVCFSGILPKNVVRLLGIEQIKKVSN